MKSLKILILCFILNAFALAIAAIAVSIVGCQKENDISITKITAPREARRTYTENEVAEKINEIMIHNFVTKIEDKWHKITPQYLPDVGDLLVNKLNDTTDIRNLVCVFSSVHIAIDGKISAGCFSGTQAVDDKLENSVFVNFIYDRDYKKMNVQYGKTREVNFYKR